MAFPFLGINTSGPMVVKSGVLGLLRGHMTTFGSIFVIAEKATGIKCLEVGDGA